MALRKNILKKFAAAALALGLLGSAASCDFMKEKVTETYEDAAAALSDKIILREDGKAMQGIVISDELLSDLRKNRPETFKAMKQYFVVCVNKEIENNVFYIRSLDDLREMSEDGTLLTADEFIRQTEKDTETARTKKILGISSSVMENGAVYGQEAIASSMTPRDVALREILSGSSLALEEGVRYSAEIAAQQKADRKTAVSKIIGKVKTVAKAAQPYGQAAMEAELARLTALRYQDSSQLLAEAGVKKLKYKDYYIASADKKVAVACGSLQAAADAFLYLRSVCLDKAVEQGHHLVIDPPKSGMHEGYYLEVNISGTPLDQFALAYEENETYYDSKPCVDYLNTYLLKNIGEKLNAIKAGASTTIQHKIIVGKTDDDVSAAYYDLRPDICDYRIEQSDGNLYFLGGSEWAIQYAMDYVIEHYFTKEYDLPSDFVEEGSIYGQLLFDRYPGSDIRIMTNNAWENGSNTAAWAAQGVSCSSYVRYPQIAKVYLAYQPDVLSIQEMSYIFVNDMVYQMNQVGGMAYKVADWRTAGSGFRTSTPILFNTETVELLDSDAHIFRYASNSNSKAYTWGYFRHKKTGATFLVFSTHLWYKSNKADPNSSFYREKQLEEVCQRANEMIETYDCPCFIMGDFNCTVTTTEFGTASKYGFSDCHDMAVAFADDISGRFVCNTKAFSYKATDAPYRKAIDHMCVKNLKQSEVLTYDYVTPNFFGKLSDHAPLYVDVKVN